MTTPTGALFASSGLDLSVGSLVQGTDTCLQNTLGESVYQQFESQPRLEGIVVLEKDTPVGLIMRNAFYQKVGSPYGYSLHMKRSISWLMDTEMLVTDESKDIAHVSSLAMKRPNKNLYDLIIVTRGGHYIGVVSVRLFLIELSQRQETQIKLLREANEKERSYSEVISSSNAELESRNQSIRNLLHHAGQGFLSFSDDYNIDKEYSAECARIFGKDLANANYLELIRPYHDNDTLQCINRALDMLFSTSNDVSAEVLFSLLPHEFIIGEKTIAIDYKLITADRVMLVLTDISDKVALARKVREDERNMRLILKAMVSYEEVRNGLDDLRECLSTGIGLLNMSEDCIKESLTELFRAVHTYKGEFSQYGLHHSAHALHELEETISQLLRKEDLTADELHELKTLLNFEEIVKHDVNVITQALGEHYFSKRETYVVRKEQILQIRHEINKMQNPEATKLLPHVMQLLCHNLKDILQDYSGYVDYLSARLEKPMKPLLVTGDDVFIQKAPYSAVLKTLVHLFRNALDHGIETLDERLMAGKCEYATIKCEIRQNGEHNIELSVSDDGSGLNIGKIREAVGAFEQDSIPDDELISYIFRDRFSTRGTVDMLSGRGVGLAAVKHEVDKIGGSISVQTRSGQGATFTITLPVFSDFSLDEGEGCR